MKGDGRSLPLDTLCGCSRRTAFSKGGVEFLARRGLVSDGLSVLRRTERQQGSPRGAQGWLYSGAEVVRWRRRL